MISTMYKTIIIDDEKGCRDTLNSMLQNHSSINIMAEASSIKEAQQLISELQPHLLFLDIEMPGGNGFELLEGFDPINFDIIFTTAYDKYAIKAIKYSALDYLLKPIAPDELQQAITRFTSKKHDQNLLNNQFKTLLNNINEENSQQKIAIHDGEGINFVKISNIIRFQSEGSYTYLHSTEHPKPILIAKPMGEYQDMLNNDQFMRVHRSHFINLQHVTKYIKSDGGYVIMTDGAKVEIARRKKAEFNEVLSKI